MALSRRTGARFQASIWPGFVDAMTGLLLVLMFVLTIFMVIQFALRETISGQDEQLNELSTEVARLADALGLERDRSASLGERVGALTTSLSDLTNTSQEQADRIAALSAERDAQAARIAGFEAQVAGLQRDRTAGLDRIAALEAERDAQASAITGFEAEVAGLLADRRAAEDRIALLEETETRLLSEQEALSLSLAQARDEISAGEEAARLAAARREALQALIADLRRRQAEAGESIAALEAASTADATRISELEAAALADAAAAQALRDELQNADAELSAMTLRLEEERRAAEETLTMLAAANVAREDLEGRLTETALALQTLKDEQITASANAAELDARLLAALGLADTTAEELAAAEAALAETEAEATALAAQLNAARAAAAAREAQAATLTSERDVALSAQAAGQERIAALEQDLADLRAAQTATASDLEAQLAAAIAARVVAEQAAEDGLTAAERQALLLAQAEAALAEETALSADAQRQVAILREEVAALRSQLGQLQGLLEASEAAEVEAQVQIDALGSRLNTALARAAAEERRRRQLEEAERARIEAERDRLAAEAQNLERFRSDFFGQMREILEGQDGVRIVGDRFVFSSEVLFEPGSADLSPEGQTEIAAIAGLLREIGAQIPDGIDWVIRVDGHTDNVPLSGQGEFADNWELSQARALSVVRYMQDFLGIPPQRMAANGFGQYQPIAAGDSPEARAQNRRIELKLTER